MFECDDDEVDIDIDMHEIGDILIIVIGQHIDDNDLILIELLI
jgi:hypothetical protein